MPKGTRVADYVSDVKRGGGGNPYAICQASTGQSYATGKKLKNKTRSKRMKAMRGISAKVARTYG